MKKSQQLKFKDPRLNALKFFGGSHTTRRTHRVARPISTKNPMHIVLRASCAQGENSFLSPRNNLKIKAHLVRLSRKFGVKILNAANVGNHIHLVVKLSHRQTYKAFICALTGAIARTVIHGSQGGLSSLRRFWDFRPFSRIVTGFRDLKNLARYLLINRLEGQGVRRERAERLVSRPTSSRLSFQAKGKGRILI